MVPFYTHDDALAADLVGRSRRLPIRSGGCRFGSPIGRFLDSKMADINNASANSYAGSITAALFLARFVTSATSWFHADIFAWNASRQAGPPGGRRGAGDPRALRLSCRPLRALNYRPAQA